jgi:hypothetical protein
VAFAPIESLASVDFSNEQLLFAPHPKPIVVSEDGLGSPVILLDDGNTLSVSSLTFLGTRVLRFDLGHAFWWVTQKGVIYGECGKQGDTTSSCVHARDDGEAEEVFRHMK